MSLDVESQKIIQHIIQRLSYFNLYKCFTFLVSLNICIFYKHEIKVKIAYKSL